MSSEPESLLVAVLVGATFGLIAWAGAVSDWWFAQVISAVIIGVSVVGLIVLGGSDQ